jgi:hypothetical protein
MAQQTAVRWIEDNIQSDMNFMEIMGLIRQAKAMEKEQMIKFAETMPKKKGVTQEGQPYVQYDAEEHYNQTYNK